MFKSRTPYRIIALFVMLCCLVFAAIAVAQQGSYVASRLREPFHYPWCKWAQ